MNNPQSVLIVDDDPVFLIDLRQILISAGYTVYSAETQEEAFRIAKAERPVRWERLGWVLRCLPHHVPVDRSDRECWASRQSAQP
jgi:CheY-like chemotaxis protein